MPIVRINVSMTIRPVNVPCPPPGGIFTIKVTVTGVAAGPGGRYDVEIYDQDLISDDLLDGSYLNGVARGNFRRQHVFFLRCDRNCEVSGRLGSGENTAEIYAYADGGRNVTAMSQVIPVSCTDNIPAERSGSRKGKSKQKR